MSRLTERTEQSNGFKPLLCSAAGVAATLVAGYAISQPPRGFRVMVTVLFVCWIEVIFGLLAYWRSTRVDAPSGASVAIMLTAAGSYAAAGLASVIAFMAVRGESSEQDGVIFGILLIETVVFFVILRRFVQHDDAAIEETRCVEQVHTLRVDQSDRIAQAVDRLKQSSSPDPIEQRRIDNAAKRLYALQIALVHSHTNAGATSPDVEVGGICDAITSVTSRFQSGTTPSEALSEIQRLAGNLESLLRLHRIS